MCRLRDLNYESLIKIDLNYTKYRINLRRHDFEVVHEKEVPKVQVADIPVMVKSNWCKLSDADE